MAACVLMMLAVGVLGTLDGVASTPSGEDRVAPNYMLDLYERNKYSAVKKGNERATTVRLISADFGRLKKDDSKVFTFNLSTVMVSEKILSAELHIFKKEGDSPNPWKDIEVLLYQINNKYTKYLGHDWLYRQQRGWQLLDVTSQVKRCLKNRKREHTLGIQLKDAVSKTDIKLNKYKRKNIRPFVVIYSNETQNLTFDHIDPRFSPRDLVSLEHQLKRNAGMQEGEVLHMTDFLQADEGPTPEKNESKSGMEKPVKDSDKRDRRSIVDNKVPQIGGSEKVEAIIVPITGGIKFPKPNQFPFSSTNPSILRERKRLRNTKYGGESSRHRSVKRKTIPYPRGFHRKQRRMRRKRRRWNRRNRRRFDDSLWKEEGVAETTARVPNGVCQRRRLRVNFQDIGWNRWIINPKSFDAYYCDGVCPFQKIKSLNPSNHATIQSIVNAIGLNSKIPQPCCVPRTMSSVSLLFFDENDNVVLKNYPGMSVEKCACQ